MIDLSYSKKLYKRVIFVFTCFFMSFLLTVTMFRTEAIAKVRDDIAESIVKSTLNMVGTSDSESSTKINENTENNDNSNNNLQNEENQNTENSGDNQNENASNDLENKTDENYSNNNNLIFGLSSKDQTNTLQGSDNSESATSNNASRLEESDDNLDNTYNIDADEQILNANNFKNSTYENSDNQANLKEDKKEEESFIPNIPGWNLVRSDEGDQDNPWWKKDDQGKQETEEGGSGTAEDPYRVGTAKRFLELLQGDSLKTDAKSKNAYITLIDDIDLSDANKAKSSQDIFRLFPYSIFSGCIDGQNHTITCRQNARTALFYQVQNATFKNLNINLAVRYTDADYEYSADRYDLGCNLALLSEEALNDVTVENCNFSGSLVNREDANGYEAKYLASVFAIAKGKKSKDGIKFINVNNNVEVSVNGTGRHYAGGFVAGAKEGAEINFSSCNNLGAITTMSATSQFFNALIEFGRMIVNGLVTSVFLKKLNDLEAVYRYVEPVELHPCSDILEEYYSGDAVEGKGQNYIHENKFSKEQLDKFMSETQRNFELRNQGKFHITDDKNERIMDLLQITDDYGLDLTEPKDYQKRQNSAYVKLVNNWDSNDGGRVCCPRLIGPIYETNEKLPNIEIIKQYINTTEIDFSNCNQLEFDKFQTSLKLTNVQDLYLNDVSKYNKPEGTYKSFDVFCKDNEALLDSKIVNAKEKYGEQGITLTDNDIKYLKLREYLNSTKNGGIREEYIDCPDAKKPEQITYVSLNEGKIYTGKHLVSHLWTNTFDSTFTVYNNDFNRKIAAIQAEMCPFLEKVGPYKFRLRQYHPTTNISLAKEGTIPWKPIEEPVAPKNLSYWVANQFTNGMYLSGITQNNSVIPFRGLSILGFLNWSKYNKNFNNFNPIFQIANAINFKNIINSKHDSVGKYDLDGIVKDIIKSSSQNLKTAVEQDKENAKEIFGDEIYNDIINNNFSPESKASQFLNETIGDYYLKRFSALTGNSQLFWNILNYDKQSANKENAKLENVDDFLAMQGRLIYEGKSPVAQLLDTAKYDEFINQKNVREQIRLIDLQIGSKDRETLYRAYVYLGKLYCIECTKTDSGYVQNKAYEQENQFSLNCQRLLRETCHDLYLKERNSTEIYEKDGKQVEIKGSAIIRNMMNGHYKDSLSWIDFTTNWGDKLYTMFEKKMLDSNIWDDKTKGLNDDEKKVLIKHFFVTYISYSGELSFYNYVPLLRASLSFDEPNIYRTDFVYNDKEIKYQELSNYIPGTDKWKFSDKLITKDHPTPYCVLLECSLLKNQDSVESFANYKTENSNISQKSNTLAAKSSQSGGSSVSPGDTGSSSGEGGNVGGGIFAVYNSLSDTLQSIASNLPNSGITGSMSHFRASAGGFVAMCESSNITFKDSVNQASVTGGDYAGGFIGFVDGASNIGFESSNNAGSVCVSDITDQDPTAGGFIGGAKSSDISVSIKSCQSVGAIASRRAAGGLIGTAYGKINLENIGVVCGIAAPRYAGGLIGISEHASRIDLKNSYTACVFDAVSNSERTIGSEFNWALNLIGLNFPDIDKNNFNDKLYCNKPGSLFGDVDKGVVDISNVYCKDGEDFVGNDQNNDFVNSNNNEEKCHAVSLDQFADGCVCYNLNNNSSLNIEPEINTEKSPFGQVVDDFTLGAINSVPLPGLNAKVYKDLASEKTIYTNYDVRNTKLCSVHLDCDSNAKLYPDKTDIYVPYDGDLTIEVSPNSGYQISRVWYDMYDDSKINPNIIGDKDLESTENNIYTAKYSLSNIKTNTTIHIETCLREAVSPKGTGLDYDPYLIYNKQELNWLNQQMVNSMNPNVHVKLMADIDYAGIPWHPLCADKNGMGFAGVFDGNGHKISNLNVDSDNSDSGAFFNSVEGNVSKGVFLSSKDNTKSVAQLMEEKDTKIAVSKTNYDCIKYLVDRFRYLDIDNKLVRCDDEDGKSADEVCIDKVISKSDNVVLAFVPNASNFDYSKLQVKVLEKTNGQATIKDLTLSGNFSDAAFAKSARNAQFINCVSEGSVSGSGLACGGIVAFASKNIKLENCENKANISFSSSDAYHTSCGGIVGCLTSTWYLYGHTVQKSIFDEISSGGNFICADIKSCKNYGHISASRTIGNNVECAGICGSFSETHYNYDFNSDYTYSESKNDLPTLDSLIVSIEKCENYGNVGDEANSNNLIAAGILANEGYFNCKTPYKININNNKNCGLMACDSQGHDTAWAGIGQEIYNVNTNAKSNNANTEAWNSYINSSKNYETVIPLDSVSSWNNIISNFVGMDEIRPKDEGKGFCGQLFGIIGLGGANIFNSFANGESCDVIGKIYDGAANASSFDSIYCRDTIDKKDSINEVLKEARIDKVTSDDVKYGKLTHDLMNFNKDFPGLKNPSFGQNIDVFQANGKDYQCQYEPNILDDDSQKVYKLLGSADYSKFTAGKKNYTNVVVEGQETDYKPDEAYKANITVFDENDKEVDFSTDIGSIKGYTTVKKDSLGNAKFSFDIIGENSNTVNYIKFADINIDLLASNHYAFNIKYINNKYYVNDKEIKDVYEDEDGFKTFSLNVKFAKTKEPERFKDYYLIKNCCELRWYSQHYKDIVTYKDDKSGQEKTSIAKAKLASDIIIPNDDYIDPIGNEHDPFESEFIGDFGNGQAYKKIVNYSSKPIFGYVGNNAKIKNIFVDSYYSGDKKWNGAVINIAKGKNIEIDHVTTCGHIDVANSKEYNENSCSAALINNILKYSNYELSSVSLTNCVNRLDLSMPVKYLAAFIAKSDYSRLYISNCANNAKITNTSSYDSYNSACIAYASDEVLNVLDVSDGNFEACTNINVCGFNNNGSIVVKGNDSTNYGATGSILGCYDMMVLKATSSNSQLNKLNILNCINKGSINAFNNVGGFVGKISLLSGVIANGLPSKNIINFEKCENCADLALNDKSTKAGTIGGFVGTANGLIDINFVKCLSSDAKISFLNSTTEVGGLIGHTQTPNSINIENCSISPSLTNLDGVDKSKSGGLIFGIYDNNNYNYINLKNSFCLIQQDKSLNKLISNYDIDTSCIKTRQEYISGAIAYSINVEENSESDASSENTFIIGQTVDKDKKVIETCPHIGSDIVYKKVFSNKEIYTNYKENEEVKDVVVQVRYMDESRSLGSGFSTILGSNDNDWIVDLRVEDKKQKLSKIKINDMEFSNETEVSLFDLRHNLSDGTKTPFKSGDVFDAQYFNKWARAKFNIDYDIIKAGINSFECAYSDSIKPIVEDFPINIGNLSKNIKVYKITSAEELYWFLDKDEEYLSDKSIVIDEDIDMSAYEWDTSWKRLNSFTGRIYGQNHRIYGINGKSAAIFNSIKSAEINDCKFQVNFNTNESMVAGLVKEVSQNLFLDNVELCGNIHSSSRCDGFGGFVCVNKSGVNYSKANSDDKILEQAEAYCDHKGISINKCKNNLESVTFDGGYNTRSFVGGFLGKLEKNACISISSSVNNSVARSSSGFSSEDYAGGFIGNIDSSRTKTSIFNCTNNAKVFGYYAGGFIARAGGNAYSADIEAEVNIKNCYNNGDVRGVRCGGIIGEQRLHNVSICKCVNTAAIKCVKDDSENQVGGIIAYVNDEAWNYITEINQCANVGEINSFSENPAGGILGCVRREDHLTINNSFSLDEVFNDFGPTRHGIVGATWDTEKDHHWLHQNYVVGSRDLYQCGEDRCYTENVHNANITTAEMLSGYLCTILNKYNQAYVTDDQNTHGYGNDGHFLNEKPSWGQRLDNNNDLACSNIYPQPNKASSCPVYKINQTDDAWSQNGNVSFANYDKASLVFNNVYKNISATDKTIHQQMYSNFENSEVGIHVNTWNYKYENGSLIKMDNPGPRGSIQVMHNDGSLTDLAAQHYNTLDEISNRYSGYFSLKSPESNHIRDYQIVVKPNNGYSVSWIAIDGVIRERAAFDAVSGLNEDGVRYNIIKAKEFRDFNTLRSHTIDIGFTQGTLPLKNKDQVYEIYNYDNLVGFCDIVKNEPSAKAKLMNDISATYSCLTNGFPMIGSKDVPFKGEFNGNNKKIIGLSKKAADHVAFIQYADHANIHDLVLSEVDFTSTGENNPYSDIEKQKTAALIANAKDITVNNVKVNGKVTSPGHDMAGLIAFISSGKNIIKNCVNNVKTSVATCTTGHVGGIVAWIDNNTETIIDSCVNTAEMRSNKHATGAAYSVSDYASGIVAYCDTLDKTLLTITRCLNQGVIRGDCSGGIVGGLNESIAKSTPGAKVQISDCINMAKVMGDYCGGILGKINRASKYSDWYSINWCINSGNIGEYRYKLRKAGGIIGEVDDIDAKLDINYCQNVGNVYAGGGYETFNVANGVQNFGQGMNFAGAFSTIPSLIQFMQEFTNVSFTSVFGLFGVALSIISAFAALIKDVIVNRPIGVSCWASGILNVGYERGPRTNNINISNTFNFGLASANDEASGICSVDDDITHVSNVYSVHNYGKHDTRTSAHRYPSSDVLSLDKFNYVNMQQLASGEITYNIQKFGKAGSYYKDGILTESKVKETEDKSIAIDKIVGSDIERVYFGQNIDRHSDKKYFVSAIPNYRYDNAAYKVYKFPKETSQNYKGRIFYSNNNTLDTDYGTHLGTLKLEADLYSQGDDLNTDSTFNESNEESTDKLSSNNNNDYDDNSQLTLTDFSSNNETEGFSESNDNKKSVHNLSDYFDIEVTGSNTNGIIYEFIDKYGDASSEIRDSEKSFTKTYNMLPHEETNIVFKPKSILGKKYSISNVEIPESNMIGNKYYIVKDNELVEINLAECNQDYIKEVKGSISKYLDDGSLEVTVDPKYLVNKDTKKEIYAGCLMRVLYRIDGTVECHIYKGIGSYNTLPVRITVNNEQSHIDITPDTHKKMLFHPYSDNQYLPDVGGPYFLTEDIDMKENWVVPKGKTYICLNGHKINMNGSNIIDLKENDSELVIFDCKAGNSSTLWKSNVDSKGQLSFEKAYDKTEENVIDGGLLYSEIDDNKSNSQGNTMFQLGSNSKLWIDSVSVFQKPNGANVVDVDDCHTDSKYDVHLNCPIYETNRIDNDDHERYAFIKIEDDSNVQSGKESSLIKFGEKFDHKEINWGPSYKHNKVVADVVFSSVNNRTNIDFDDNYKFEKPLKIDAVNLHEGNTDYCINLTSNFNKFIEKGVKYDSVFESLLGDNSAVALTSYEKTEASEKDDSWLNNLCICDKSNLMSVNVDVSGPGNIYPEKSNKDYGKIQIYYKKGSKIQMYYDANVYSYLESFETHKKNAEELIVTPKDSFISIALPGGTDVTTLKKDDTHIQAKGKLYIGDIDFNKGDNISYLFDEHESVSAQVQKNCKASELNIVANFMSVQNPDVDLSNAIEWGRDWQSSRLPESMDLPNTGKYQTIKLVNDICMSQPWEIKDNRKIILDLNGMSVSLNQDDDRIKYDNIIKIDNKDAAVTIVDSSILKNDAPVRSFIKNDDGSYRQVVGDEANQNGVKTVKGGVIYGANTISNTYYRFEQTAGAIDVESGVLNFVSGNLAFNKSDGRLGGAAVSIKEDGKAFINKNAHINNNVCLGDNQYKERYAESHYFAAAIASDGYLFNDGDISNNTAELYSASAVEINKGTFDNTGSIANNICMQDKDEKSNHSKDSFGAVYVNSDATFNNDGLITNNKADFECPAFINNGKTTIKSNSKIYNNTWGEDTSTDDPDYLTVSDITLYRSLEYCEKLNSDAKYASVVSLLEPGSVITKSWDKSASYIDNAFKMPKNNPDKLVFARNGENEVKVATENSTCKLDIWYVTDDSQSRQTSLLTDNLNTVDRYIAGDTYTVKTVIKEGFEISTLKINSEEVAHNGKDKNLFRYTIKTWDNPESSTSTHVIPVYFNIEEVTNNNLRASLKWDRPNTVTWNDDKNLPIESGNYILQKDVCLDETWVCPKNCYIDLNSHKITISEENKNIIYIKDSNFMLDDTSLGTDREVSHYLSKKDADDDYILTDIPVENRENIEIVGGVIGDTKYVDAERSGAIYEESGNMQLLAGNIVANCVYNKEARSKENHGKGASAIYVGKNAQAEFGNDLNISYNYSQCSSEEKYEYGAAGLEVRGTCTSAATISHNTGNYNSVAGVAVISNGSQFVNEGQIVDNKAMHNSVAGLLICSDDVDNLESDNVVCNNWYSGKIQRNTASDNSIAGVELYGKLINQGKIRKNTSLTQNSYAGVYAYGSLVLEGKSEISQNLCSAYTNDDNKMYQDIQFDEDNYDQFVVGAQNQKALFTLGDEYDPPTTNYNDEKLQTSIPRSMVHVNVKNYINDENKDTAKPLLLARGYRFSDIKTMQNINSYFEVVDDDYSISAGEYGEIYYNRSSENAKLHVSSNAGGDVNCLGTTITPISLNTKVDLNIKAKDGYRISKVEEKNIDTGEVVNYEILDDYTFNKKIVNNAYNKQVNITFAAERIVNYQNALKSLEEIQTIERSDNYTEWLFCDALPSWGDKGIGKVSSWKLMTDVTLSEAWTVPKGVSMRIDLNGHNINLRDGKNNHVIKLDSNNTFLELENSKRNEGGTKVGFRYDEKLEKYVVDNKNPYLTSDGGCIYGGNAIRTRDDISYDWGCGGAVYVGKDSYFAAHDINFIGNNAEVGGAVYAEGQAVFSNIQEFVDTYAEEIKAKSRSVVACNTALKGGAAFCTQQGGILLDTTVRENYAKEVGAGVFVDGLLQFGTKLRIYSNRILNKSLWEQGIYKYDDIALRECTYDGNNTDSARGSFITAVGDISNNEKKDVYLKCLGATKDNEDQELFCIAINEDVNAKTKDVIPRGVYVVEKDGIHQLINKEHAGKILEDTYKINPRAWMIGR